MYRCVWFCCRSVRSLDHFVSYLRTSRSPRSPTRLHPSNQPVSHSHSHSHSHYTIFVAFIHVWWAHILSNRQSNYDCVCVLVLSAIWSHTMYMVWVRPYERFEYGKLSERIQFSKFFHVYMLCSSGYTSRRVCMKLPPFTLIFYRSRHSRSSKLKNK